MDVLALIRELEADGRIPLTVLAGATPARVAEAEARLGLTFPSDYRRFLEAFGAAEVGGRAIFGLGAELDTVDGLNMVWHTEQARQQRGLADAFIVLSAWDDLTLEVARVREDDGGAIDGPVSELLVEGRGDQLAANFSQWLERTVREAREDHAS